MNKPLLTRSAASRRKGRSARRKGSILLMVLMMSGGFAMLSVSMNTSIRSQMNLQRDNVQSLHASFAAESGLEFIRRQVTEDPLWTADGTDQIELSDGNWYTVRRTDVPDADNAVTAVFEIEGVQTVDGVPSRFRLTTSALLTPGDLARTMALVQMGEKLKLKNSFVDGPIALANDPAKNFFWNPGNSVAGTESAAKSDWFNLKKSPKAKKGNYKIEGGEINGALYTRDETLFEAKNDAVIDSVKVTDKDLFSPSFDLDQYRVPSDDTIVMDFTLGKGKADDVDIMNLDADKTVVVIVNKGSKVRFENVNLLGGVVILEDDNSGKTGQGWVFGDKTKVEIRGSNVFGGGSDGVSESLGILAMGMKVEGKKGWTTQSEIDDIVAELALKNELTGQEMNDLKDELEELLRLPKKPETHKDDGSTTINGILATSQAKFKKSNLFVNGQVLTFGKKAEFDGAVISYNADVAANPPPGFQYAGEMLGVDVNGILTNYDMGDLKALRANVLQDASQWQTDTSSSSIVSGCLNSGPAPLQ